LKFHPHKKPCEFSQTRDSAPTDFYRFLCIFCVFRPSLEPEFWAEKPPCIEGLFSGIALGTPKVAKIDKNDKKSVFLIKFDNFNNFTYNHFKRYKL
jgi:hypothetical protein